MKVVLDANVLVSGFSKPGTPSEIIDQWAAGAFELILSEHIMDGVRRAWSKPYFRRFFTEAESKSIIDGIVESATMRNPVDVVHGVAEDREDDLVLATAITARADVLVTGDRLLREIDRYEVVRILTPREFLDLLDQEWEGGRVWSSP